jgi:lipoate-protein ligase A
VPYVKLAAAVETEPGISFNGADNLRYEQELFDRLREAPQPRLLFYRCDPCLVVCRSNRLEQWVHQAAVAADGLPLLRRSSGGGAVYLDRDCLNFSFMVPKNTLEELLGRSVAAPPSPPVYIDFFRGILLAALARCGRRFTATGISDVSLDGQKISGNAQRISPRLVLHHGTLLLRCPLAAYERYLPIPPNRPGVPHAGFVSGLSELGCTVSAEDTMRWIAAEFAARLNRPELEVGCL